MSCEQTTFSFVHVKMQRERLKSQTKEVVANVMTISRKSAGVNRLKELLNEPLMPQEFMYQHQETK